MSYLRKSEWLCGHAWKTISWTCRGEPSGNITVKINTGSLGEDYWMELDYRTRSGEEEWKPMLYRVRLESTPCRYGGKRWWFICPNTRCSRRNSILYQSSGYFVCRKCTRLKYASQEYSGKFSLLRNLFEAEAYEMKINRWYYRGKPTRKHRRFLKMTRGLSERDRLNACLSMLRG